MNLAGEIEMNEKQAAIVEYLRTGLVRDMWRDLADRYEVKRFDVKTETIGRRTVVFAHVIVGRKGDEGTLGEVLARDTFHWMIGPRGACRRIDLKARVTGHPAVTWFKRDKAVSS